MDHRDETHRGKSPRRFPASCRARRAPTVAVAACDGRAQRACQRETRLPPLTVSAPSCLLQPPAHCPLPTDGRVPRMLAAGALLLALLFAGPSPRAAGQALTYRQIIERYRVDPNEGIERMLDLSDDARRHP